MEHWPSCCTLELMIAKIICTQSEQDWVCQHPVKGEGLVGSSSSLSIYKELTPDRGRNIFFRSVQSLVGCPYTCQQSQGNLLNGRGKPLTAEGKCSIGFSCAAESYNSDITGLLNFPNLVFCQASFHNWSTIWNNFSQSLLLTIFHLTSPRSCLLKGMFLQCLWSWLYTEPPLIFLSPGAII